MFPPPVKKALTVRWGTVRAQITSMAHASYARNASSRWVGVEAPSAVCAAKVYSNVTG